jgi:LmbE family N-acetylglucosaminyl deacetylase
MSKEKRVVMVVAAHPDDCEVGVGGTIIKWVKEGTEVICVVCTNGDKGSSDQNMTSTRLAEIREKEQRAASAVLGIKEVIFLGYPDGWLEDTPEFRGKLVRLIRRYQPDLVITHDPHRKYLAHRDHRTAGTVTLDAVFPYSRDQLFYPEHKSEGLKPFTVKELWLFGSDNSDTFEDISETFEQKGKALACHVSQFGDHTEDWDEWMKTRRKRAEDMGKGRGIPLAEAFLKVPIR